MNTCPKRSRQRNGGLQNTWFLKAGAKADIVKNLDAMVNVYYLRAVNAYMKEFGIGGQNTDLSGIGKSKSIGTEADAIVNYHIDRNLTYYVEGGYLFWQATSRRV